MVLCFCIGSSCSVVVLYCVHVVVDYSFVMLVGSVCLCCVLSLFILFLSSWSCVWSSCFGVVVFALFVLSVFSLLLLCYGFCRWVFACLLC